MDEQMKTYRVAVVWEMWGTIEVEAFNEDHAAERAIGDMYALPSNGEYVTDSCQIDSEFPIEEV